MATLLCQTPSNRMSQNDYYDGSLFQSLDASNYSPSERRWHAPRFVSQLSLRRTKSSTSSRASKKCQSISPPVGFVVRESGDAYFLEGTLPEARSESDISMEWTGERTLVIKAGESLHDIKEELGNPDMDKPEEQQPLTSPPQQEQMEDVRDDYFDVDDEDLTLHRCLTNEYPPCPLEYQEKTMQEEGWQRRQSESVGSHRTASQDSSASTTTRRPSIVALKKRLSWGSSKIQRSLSDIAPGTTPVVAFRNLAAVERSRSNGGGETTRREFSFAEDVEHHSLKASFSQGVLNVMATKIEPTTAEKPRRMVAPVEAANTSEYLFYSKRS